VIAIVLALAAGGHALRHLRVNADQDAMFSDEMPHRLLEAEYLRLFPALYENVVVVVDAPTSEAAATAARRLAQRMREATEFFHDVYLPRGAFFDERALLYMDTGELDRLADRLARMQPYLAGLSEDGSLRGLAMLLARGARAAREGDVSGAELRPILERVAAVVRGRLAGATPTMSWAAVVAGRAFEAGDDARRIVIAQPVLDFSQLAVAGASMEALRRFADELGLDGAHGIRVRVTGDVVLSYEEMRLVEQQAVAAGVASFVAVTALLAWALRSLRLVLAVVVSLLVGLLLTSGFAAVAVGHLNLISIAFAVLFIGLAADFSLHVCMRYQELCAGAVDRARAITVTARSVGPSVLLCAMTTAIGFYAFVPTDFSGVAELGLIAGTGMLIGVAVTFTVVPAMLALGRRPHSVRGAGVTARLPSFAVRYPSTVVALALVAAAGALALLPRVRFDENPLRVRDPSAESVRTFEEVLQGRTSPWSMGAVAPTQAQAQALAERLRALTSVGSAETLLDYLPSDQQEKLDILEDASLFLLPPARAAVAAAPSPAEQLAALRELDAELERLVRSGGAPDEGEDTDLRAQALALHEALALLFARSARADDPASLLAAVEQGLVGSLDEQLDALERLLSVDAVGVEDLPEGLRRRMISAEGPVRVAIHPAEDLSDSAALERFVEQVRSVAPRASGDAAKIYEASRAAVRSLRQAFATAVVVIALLLLLLWRTLDDALLVLAPLGLAALLTSAATVVVGIPFNFADIIVLPLLLGIGVDSGIHLVHRARLGDVAQEQLLHTSTARAVVFSALTTLASFGSLAFSTHRGMASLGQLLALGVALTLVANLFVLPALLALRGQRTRAARPLPGSGV